MLPAERKRTIVELVSERDGCAVAELADELGFSKATIRRDLGELEDERRVERSHGGAVPVSGMGEEQSYGQKEIRNLAAKEAIAERAVQEIHPDQVVCFDAGTTTMEVAKRAPDGDDFLGVTSSPMIAQELAANETTVKLTGGTLRPETRALVGPTAEAFVERTNFDTLFLGTNGLTAESGLTTPNETEAEMKSRMVQAANRVVLVTDASKLGEQTFVRFATIPALDLFVTEGPVSDSIAEAAGDADVTIAEVNP